MTISSYVFGFLSAAVISPILCAATEYPDPYAPPFYNNEIVPLPSWVKEEFRDINAKLRAKLSPSDYLEILKGEYHLLKDAPARAHAIQGKRTDGLSLHELAHPTKLRAKLQQILDNPDDNKLFARPHFVKQNDTGTFFREDLRYAYADLYWEDEEYTIGRSPNSVNPVAATFDFWNTRTCRKDIALATPTPGFFEDSFPHRIAGTQIYTIPTECGEYSLRSLTWFDQGSAIYYVAPHKEIYTVSYDFLVTGEMFDYCTKSDLYRELPPNYEIDNQSQLSAGIQELGLPPIPKEWNERMGKEETTYHLQTNEINHPHTLCLLEKNRKGWALNINTLKFVYNSMLAATPQEQSSSTKLDKQLHQVLDCTDDGKVFGPQRFNWEAAYQSNPCNHHTAFFVKNWRRFYAGIQLPNGDIRMLPPLSSISEQSLPIFSIQQLGKITTIDYTLDDSGRTEQIQIINTEKIINYYHTPRHIQIEANHQNKRYIYLSAEMSSGHTECWQLELSADDNNIIPTRHWKYANSRLLAHYHAGLEMMFIPACNNSYWVKKLLPDGGEKDMGRLFVNPMQGYAFVLPDGRYAGSPGCEAFLGFGDGNTSVGMEALAPWRNRPADVLKALDGNPDDIAALQQTTERWLKKQGYDINNMPAEPKLSDFAQMKVQLPPLFTTKPKLEVEVELSPAEKRAVTALEVRVDGVRIPQSWEADLLIPAGQKRKLTVTVPLGSGQNWIELTPVDSLGTAGAPFQFRTICKGQYEPEMYVVTLGVSDYADDSLDLQYAAKDARDVAAAFEKHSGYRVRTLTLTDAEVTPQAMSRVQGFLSAATPDDCVVLYVAGHGMLDSNLDYYYAPHHFSPENVAESGISMEALRGCLTASPARKRLLLLDTCHSGSVGEADMDKLAMNGVQLPPGVRAIANRGMKVSKTTKDLDNQQQTKRYIEEMFSSGTARDGINVLAGSAGAEFAMESDQWSNGVFTTALISTLQNPTEADTNKDAQLSIGELLYYVPARVQQMTGGMQSPSIQLVENVKTWTIQPCPADSPAAMQQWVARFKQTSPLNELDYMKEHYETQVTDLNSGKTMSIDELISEQYAYINRWTNRDFDVIDYKIKGNRIEIRSQYRCTNTKGKTVSGFSKTTWIISPNGRIQAFADDSSTQKAPDYSPEISDSDTPQSTQTSNEAPPKNSLTEETARQWAQRHQQDYPINELSYMRNCYEPMVTELKSGKTMSIDELINDQYSYTSRWVTRSSTPHDFAWGQNRVEIRFRYTCTNTKGKTVRGYCKATWQISENGLIEAYADDSSTTSWPAFSPEVGEPRAFR